MGKLHRNCGEGCFLRLRRLRRHHSIFTRVTALNREALLVKQHIYTLSEG